MGTGFSRREGRATLQVTRLAGDSLEVSATCDSLAREVVRLTEELTQIMNQREEKEQPARIIREPTGWQWTQLWLGRIALLLLAVRLVYKRFKQHLKVF